mgnify:CR=1 FL=1
MHKVYLLIGGNIGNRKAYLLEAKSFLSDIGNIVQESSIYETAAWGKVDQQAFLNQAVLLITTLSANDLLDSILQIEEKMGRKRLEHYGPRTIDIDILLFDDMVLNSNQLHIPHLAMAHRKFTLVPLAEIAPSVMHPVLQKSIQKLFEDCTDTLAVELYIH